MAAEWQQGDIILQEGHGGQADMIKRASGSKWTHVGVVVKDKHGSVRVLEAVQPVKFTTVKAFVARTKTFKILRLKNPVKMTPDILKKAEAYVSKQVNKNYDIKFGWGDDKMYCSELVWKCYNEILGVELCKPRSYESYNLDDPLVRQAIHKRFGGRQNVPKNHKVVAPGDIATSELLKDVTPSFKAKFKN